MEYVFYGKVIPSYLRVTFNIKDPPIRLTVNSKVGIFTYTLLLNNTDDVVVKIDSDNELEDIATLLDIARSLTQSYYDTALLSTGVLSFVLFSSIYLPNKTLAQISNFTPWLPVGLFDFETETLFTLKNNHTVRIATLDIKYACLEPDLTALFSYRAIEGIMNSFDEKNDRNKKWLLLRDHLNLSRDFFEHTEKLSIENRHGKNLDQTMDDRKLCILTALITLQRYMHYLISNKTKLHDHSFPLLSKGSIALK